jgi:hypothetical protein
MRGMMADANVRLLRAIRTTIGSDRWFDGWYGGPDSAGPSLVIEGFDSEPWASMTFRGERHRISIRLEGEMLAVEAAYDRLEALFTEPDLDLPGHVLAEMQLAESNGEIHPDGRMRLAILFEALTLEE